MKEIVNMLYLIIVFIICTTFIDLCYAKLNKTKTKFNLRNVIIILITAGATILNNLYNNNELKTLFSMIIVSVNFKLLYKKDLKNIVISYILIFLILIFLEICITNLLSVFNILQSESEAYSLNVVKLSLSLLIGILEYLLFCFKFFKNSFQKVQIYFIQNSNIGNISYLMFLTMALLGMLNVKYFANTNSVQFIFYLIFIFTILFIIIIKTKTNEILLKESNKRLIDYNEKYGKFLDDYKIYKHNINNKLIALKSYGDKKVNELIDDLLEETSFSIKNNNLYNVPKGIKGLIVEKLYNIDLSVLIYNKIIKDPFQKLSPKKFNILSESLGICLDNAIEASCETNNPIIIMDLYEDNESIYIKIGNNFCNSIDLEEIGNKFYSTKGRGSGLGLFSIMQNNLIKEKIEIINDFYYIELQIKKANS